MARRRFPTSYPGLAVRLLLPRELPCPQPQAAIARALDAPLGAPPLAQVLAGAHRVAILVSDATRHTQSHLLLPALLARLRQAGLAEQQATLVIARGLHPPVPEADLRRLLGKAWARLPVVQHDCDHPDLARLGTTSQGTPVEVNRLVAEADRIILTGTVSYHYYAGYGGGRKSLVPGVASRRTIQANHRLLLAPGGGVHPRARAGMLVGNPVHEDMLEAAARLSPHFLVNVVNHPQGRLAGCFAGDWLAAHQAAVDFLDAHCRLQYPSRQPLVLASAGGPPHDLTLYQAHKAMDAAARLVADGGVLVLEAGCAQGLGPPEYGRFLDWADPARIEQHLRTGEYCVPAQTAHATLSKTRRIRVILVSAQLAADAARRAGALLALDMDQALAQARRLLPRLPPEVVVMPAAGSLLVEVANLS